MNLLLDTHALLWWQLDDPRLGPRTRAMIEDASIVFVSIASLWEIVIKSRLGKLRVDVGEVQQLLVRDQMQPLPILPAHLAALAKLTAHHRDPLDHMLIAQAITEKTVLVSQDRWVSAYPVTGRRCSE